MNTSPPKPESSSYRPELVSLPKLTPGRRVFRRFMQGIVRLLIKFLLHVEVSGRDNIPDQGPILLVSNHLGDADVVVGLALAPEPIDLVGKVELYDLPIVGCLMHTYGTIWVHRGRPDRRAIRAALKGLSEGRMVAIAPEGRESVTGELEEGTRGAAYLALKADVPILPVAVTGTENWRVYGNIKRLRRTKVSFTIGKPFELEEIESRRETIKNGTERIMGAIADLLPPVYQGVYRKSVE